MQDRNLYSDIVDLNARSLAKDPTQAWRVRLWRYVSRTH